MQLVAEELGARVATVAVVYSEEAALGPLLLLTVARLGDVEDDRHAVLVVVAHEALIGYRRVAPDDAVPLDAAFGRLLVRDDDAGARLQRKLGLWCLLVCTLLVDHLGRIEGRELLDLLQHSGHLIDFDLRAHQFFVLLEQRLAVEVHLSDEILLWLLHRLRHG